MMPQLTARNRLTVLLLASFLAIALAQGARGAVGTATATVAIARAATDAARVGGDFYDLISLGANRLMVVVGDVCGKGLAAAAESAVVRYMLRAYAQEEPPGQALARLNATVLNQLPGQPFVTLVVAYVDVARHMIEYAGTRGRPP